MLTLCWLSQPYYCFKGYFLRSSAAQSFSGAPKGLSPYSYIMYVKFNTSKNASNLFFRFSLSPKNQVQNMSPTSQIMSITLLSCKQKIHWSCCQMILSLSHYENYIGIYTTPLAKFWIKESSSKQTSKLTSLSATPQIKSAYSLNVATYCIVLPSIYTTESKKS